MLWAKGPANYKLDKIECASTLLDWDVSILNDQPTSNDGLQAKRV